MTDASPTRSTEAGLTLRHAVRHFAVSTGVTVDAAAMAASLRTGDITGEIADETRVALASHLHEADPAEIANLIEGSATVAGLKRLASALLPADHRNSLPSLQSRRRAGPTTM